MEGNASGGLAPLILVQKQSQEGSALTLLTFGTRSPTWNSFDRIVEEPTRIKMSVLEKHEAQLEGHPFRCDDGLINILLMAQQNIRDKNNS